MADADVSQVGAGSEVAPGATDADLNPTPNADSTDAGTNSEPDFDFEGLQKQMAALSEQTASKVELEGLKRAAGHIPGVMSKLDALEKRLEAGATDPRVDALIQRIELLIEGASPLLPEETTSKLKEPSSKPLTMEDVNKTVEERLAAIAAEEDAKKPLELDPETARDAAIADAQWASAATALEEYAQKVGVDIGVLKPEDYVKAQTDTFSQTHRFGDPITGLKMLMKKIDDHKATVDRRAARASDADTPKMPAGTQGGTLTLAAMEAMSVEELMKIPRAERDAALKAGV